MMEQRRHATCSGQRILFHFSHPCSRPSAQNHSQTHDRRESINPPRVQCVGCRMCVFIFITIFAEFCKHAHTHTHATHLSAYIYLVEWDIYRFLTLHHSPHARAAPYNRCFIIICVFKRRVLIGQFFVLFQKRMCSACVYLCFCSFFFCCALGVEAHNGVGFSNIA